MITTNKFPPGSRVKYLSPKGVVVGTVVSYSDGLDVYGADIFGFNENDYVWVLVDEQCDIYDERVAGFVETYLEFYYTPQEAEEILNGLKW
jgi:hypothetical protein